MRWKDLAFGKSEKIRIVVADDHVVLLESLAALLGTQNWIEVVGLAREGKQAVDFVREHQPDVLLLDLFMPGTDGFEVLRTLERNGLRVNAVVLTGSESHFDYVQVVRLGARGLVLKSDGPQKLFDAIRTVASGDLAFSSDIANSVVHSMANEPRHENASLARLSERERQIVGLIARGMKNRDIAGELTISENTVKRHLQSIFNKTGTRDRLELAVLAMSELARAA